MNNNAEQAKKLHQENEDLKEKLYVEGVKREKERKTLFRIVMTILGGVFVLNFFVPLLLGMHQSGYAFLKRALERNSIKKAWGTPAEPHILLDADVWEDAFIQRVEEMGFSIAQHTVERNLATGKKEFLEQNMMKKLIVMIWQMGMGESVFQKI